MKKAIILHVAPHLGGGVGRFFKNTFYGDSVFEHRFALLENPIDVGLLPPVGSWFVIDSHATLMAEIDQADIVQVEFWNHPRLYQFLAQIHTWPKCRIVLYSHVSGLFPPAYLPPAAARIPDRLILATPASIRSDAVSHPQSTFVVIPVFGGADRTIHIQKKSHPGFRVLYLGTADSLKIHPDLISWCLDLQTHDSEIIFTFCTQDDPQLLKNQIPENAAGAFEFYERVEELSDIMSTSDAFGYALHPRHYGTGEQALLEAMGAGLTPVVLDNPVERYIVQHGVTGLVARNGREYKESILFLKQNPEINHSLGKRARHRVMHAMSAETTRRAFHQVYHEMRDATPKKLRENPGIGTSPWEIFLLSQGPDAKIFDDAINAADPFSGKLARWQLSFYANHKSTSKGTITHWSRIFPRDTNLLKLKTLLFELTDHTPQASSGFPSSFDTNQENSPDEEQSCIEKF